jgi:hypothetical protein
VRSLNDWRIHLTRVEVWPGVDAWTALFLGACALVLLAAVVAWIVSVVRRARSPEGVDLDAEFGIDARAARQAAQSRMSGWDLAKLAAAAVFIVYCGLDMLISGHASGYSHGTHYSADGAPVRFAGGLLLFCVGLLVAAGLLARRNSGPPQN